MRIDGIRILEGPNVYHHKPVMIMSLRLEELTERESCEVPGFVARLVDLLPGLAGHHCSRGRPGGFVERLHEGTYFGHVVEHVALELAGLLGSPVTYGKTRYGGEPGLYDVIVRYRSEAAMRTLLPAAVELVDAVVRGEAFCVDAPLESARERIAATELGPSTRAIVDAAEERGIPWRRLNDLSLVQLGYGKHRKLIQAALTSETNHIAVETASDKALTKRLLREAFLPVPRGVVAERVEEATSALEELGGRVVVKPLDGNQGKGVSLDLTTPEQVASAFEVAAAFSRQVIVEEQLEGKDYRILVVGGRMVAASERLPCHVVGDGEKTVAALIEEANRDPLRGDGHEKPLTKIAVDDVALAHLAQTGRSLDDVPAAQERVFLRRGANLSQGGTASDVTDQVHAETRRVCERAARVLGLDVCGVDLIAPDISRPLRGGIVEVNAAPGLRMHLHPNEGSARSVGRAVIEKLYPNGASGRIPIVSVTGTNGKTTVTRLIAHVLGSGGTSVGMTTSDGVHVGGACIARGDMTGPSSARAVLVDPAVEIAVLETARGGILRRGLGYDWADVSVVTNIRADHIGQDGIEDVDDLVWIKSLVAERTRAGGTLVLNADDREAAELRDRPRIAASGAAIAYFSVGEGNFRMWRHLAEGGVGYLLKDGWIVEAAAGSYQRIAKIASIPIALGGAARHQVENCLAAVAACRALGCAADQIGPALYGFESGRHNPGRANLFQYGKGYVMIDYGHNADAFEATCAMTCRWQRPVIGIIGVPGDRDDAIIAEAARTAARGFDRIVVREDEDLRGRKPGEVAELLCRAVRSEDPSVDCRVVLDEIEALHAVLDDVAAGAAAVLFYSELEPVLAALEEAGARAVEAADVMAPSQATTPAADSEAGAQRLGMSLEG